MVVVNKLSQRETGVTYRTPYREVRKSDPAFEEQGPKPVSTIGGGRGGSLMAFSQAVNGTGAR